MNAHDLRIGFFSALGAYFIWGSLPLYVRALDNISAAELLSHRVIWSVPTAVILLVLAGKWRTVRTTLTPKRVGWLAVSGLMIGINWLVYIWAVNADRTMEASLGYYINPLVNVVIGFVFFSERLRPAQWMAVAVAAIGVAIMTIAFGRFPWIALVLCFTFAFYSIIRKQVPVDSRAGFLVEVLILLPLAMIWMTWFLGTPDGTAFGDGGWDVALLLMAGPVTAVPLILFGLAAKRLTLSTIGMMQYIGPTLQFLIATLIFQEPFGWVHATAFGCIWAALAIFTTDSVMGEAKARRLARAAGPL
jgi:chloramphenicol-sensitive protein RarD